MTQNPNSKPNLSRTSRSELVAQDAPHLWEVKIPNHPNGVKQMHCGNRLDAERLLEIYPDATMNKRYFPGPPSTVNVQATNLGKEEVLREAAKALPESESIKLEL